MLNNSGDYSDHEKEAVRECDQSFLLTQFNKIRLDTKVLSLKSIHDLQIPVCSFLRQLSSTDCLKLIKYELDDWSNQNQPSDETMLLNYLVTDYISCGLSSPWFYVEFHKTLQSKNSKFKLLNDLLSIWNCLFKSYKITSLNVAFIKQLVFSLNSIFIKISNSIPEYNVTWKWNKLVDKMKRDVNDYEQNILFSMDVLTSRENNMQQNNPLQEKDLSIQNTVKKSSESKVTMPTKTLMNQKINSKTLNMESLKCVALPSGNINILSHQQNYFEQSADHHQSKKIKLIMLNDGENAKPDTKTIMAPPLASLPSEQKLNVFQLMMLNAKKLKANTK